MPATEDSKPIDFTDWNPYRDRLRRDDAFRNWVRLFGGRYFPEGRTIPPAIGWRYRNCTLENFRLDTHKQREVVERLHVFIEQMPEALEKHGGLILYGPPGTGKDHLLAALMREAIKRHSFSVEWFDGGQLYDEFFFASRADDDTLKKLQERLSAAHILAISDPQPPRGDLSDAQLRRLRDAIDRRYRDGLATWITTNLDERKLTETIFSGPLMQRLREGAGQIHCDWPPHRDQVETW